MARLALNGNGRFVSLAAIARIESIPAGYLEKVLTKLEKSGFVRAKKGSSGGYRLARPARKITIGQVLCHLENQATLVRCIDDRGRYSCPNKRQCVTKSLWQKVQAAVGKYLFSITLDDVVKKNL